MTASPIIIWFRQDLRRHDNPALHAACNQGCPVIPVYILDDDNAGDWPIGDASRWWLHESLKKLDESLSGHLHLRRGDAKTILPQLVRETGASAVYRNRCYEPWRLKRDNTIEQDLQKQDIEVKSFNASLLFEPWTTLKDDGTPYRVFTPFYQKGCLKKNGEPDKPLPAPERLTYDPSPKCKTELDDLGLLPKSNWHEKIAKHWQPGEDGAQKRFNTFLESGLRNYKENRNRPDLENVSRLSPHLHYGEISARAIWHRTKIVMQAEGLEKDGETFLSELGWREFSYSLLYHFPDLPHQNLQKKFDHFPWREDNEALKRWQRGQTGYPVVDAGMRELWQTGYMHNRVRMIVGSFLIKDLLLHWHHGKEWFWDTLVDADLANNSASWQWIAGCGADAAPYFRIFNPVTQGRKFDPNGDYVRRYVPELANMPDKYLHAPWEAPEDIRAKIDYPDPVVDHKEAREKALAAFQKTKDAA